MLPPVPVGSAWPRRINVHLRRAPIQLYTTVSTTGAA